MPFLEISATSFTQKKPAEGMLDTSCEHPLQTSDELGKRQEEAGDDPAHSSRTGWRPHRCRRRSRL